MPTALIVEDEAMVLVLAESVIQHAGYTTLTASSVAEAKGIIESDVAIDIVFTDLSLKDEEDGGIAIGKFVLETRPDIPVLYTSGRPFTDGLSALFIEKSSFLPKPYTDDQVTAELAKLLDRQNHVRERKTSER